MKRQFIFALLVALAANFAVSTTARAAGTDPAQKCGAAAPVVAPPFVDVIEDGEESLKLVALPALDGEGTALTLVYDDGISIHSATVNPALVATTDAATWKAFIDTMDPSFVSFVRASLADRLLHLQMSPTPFERAQLRLFFPSQVKEFNTLGAAERATTGDRAE